MSLKSPLSVNVVTADIPETEVVARFTRATQLLLVGYARLTGQSMVENVQPSRRLSGGEAHTLREETL